MSPQISTIIPAYNIADYIEKTLNSVIQQTYKNIEIIVVDDGSTDDTYGVCKRFADFNSNFDIQVIHKENGGVSSARNAGILAAKGEYICFVDGDDLVSCNMVESLYRLLGTEDMSSCGFEYYGEGKSASGHRLATIDSGNALMELCDNGTIPYSACAKLYRTEICREILFDCNTGILEDFLFVCEYISRIKNVRTTDEVMYYYVKRETSALGSPFSHKRMDLIYSYKKAIKIVKSRYPQIVPYYNCSFFVELIELNLRMPRKKEFNEDRKNVLLEIRSLRNSEMQGHKIKLLKVKLYKISPILYKLVMNIYRFFRK